MSNKKSVSKTLIAAIIVIVVVIAGAAGYVYYRNITSSSQVKTVVIAPSSPNTLIDIGTMGQIYSPDALDPATGFYVVDEPVFLAVYQGLVGYNGSSITQLVPVLAKSWVMEPNGSTYVFIMRPNTYFSNGDPINATTAWFSFYRTILMAQGPGVSNYEGIIAQFKGPYFLPVGASHAVQYAFHLSSLPSPNQTAAILSQVLSNFNAHNSTIEALMSYRNQSVVMLNSSAVEFNLLEPYSWFTYDISSGWWGEFADPAFVDAHGGVQAGQANSYINTNGMVGSGPYVISSVGSEMSSITLKANSNYWAAKATDVPWTLAAPKIPNVIIEYGASHADRVAEFDSNQAQLSYVSIPAFNSLYGGYQYKQYVPFSKVFENEGMQPGVGYIALNTQVYPTNITDFRLALVHAVNYTQIIDSIYAFNGTALAGMYVGPITPTMPLYNPDHLPVYSFNLTLAEQYLNESGWQGGFYVVLPSGNTLGNPNGKELPAQTIYTIAPVTPSEETEFEIIQKDLSNIGISTSLYPVTPSLTDTWMTPSVTDGWSTASGTPSLVMLGWFPDWPDPVFQQLMVQTDPEFGGLAGDLAWLNNSQLNALYQKLPWETNQTEQEQGVAQAYNTTYWLAPYVWLPQPYTYWFQQPYLQGVTYNPFTGYYYNLMYYANYTAAAKS